MGRVILQLCVSGNIFFQNLKVIIKSNPEKDPCIQIHFPLLAKKILYYGPVTEELQNVCRSMEVCYKDWCDYMSEMRYRNYALNHYTSQQIVYLSHWIKKICEGGMPVPQQIWHLLNPLKSDTTLDDIRQAFENVKKSYVIEHQYHNKCELIYEDDDIYADEIPEELSDSTICLKQLHKTELQEDSDEDEISFQVYEELSEIASDEFVPEEDMDHFSSSDQEFEMEETIVESLKEMWQDFLIDKSRYLQQHMDIEFLSCFLSSLSDMNQLHIKRILPPILQEGKPNLVLCHPAEMITTTLSFYMESPEQRFPSVDEVLMCTESTTEEEVEIFLRRCLGQGAPRSHKKIYTLFNPGLLMYDVGVALVEHFEEMERRAGSHYRIVLVSPVNQDRYVPSFFSNYKVQAGLMVCEEKAKEYIRQHFKVPVIQGCRQAYLQGLSSWMVSSRRPAVGMHFNTFNKMQL